MRAALVCLSLLILSGCAASRSGKAMNAAVIGSGVADLITTRAAIASGRGREANVLLGQSWTQQAIVKSAGVGAVLSGAWWLEEKGHPVLSQIVRGVAISAWTFAAVHNAGVQR